MFRRENQGCAWLSDPLIRRLVWIEVSPMLFIKENKRMTWKAFHISLRLPLPLQTQSARALGQNSFKRGAQEAVGSWGLLPRVASSLCFLNSSTLLFDHPSCDSTPEGINQKSWWCSCGANSAGLHSTCAWRLGYFYLNFKGCLGESQDPGRELPQGQEGKRVPTRSMPDNHGDWVTTENPS